MQPQASDDKQINAMIKALDSPDWATRSAASAALASMGEKAREALLKEIDSESMRRAVGAARVLSEHNEPRIYAVMQRLVTSQNPLLGQIAVDYVINFSAESAPGFLIGSLSECTYIVQISIVQALGKMRAQESYDCLIALLKQTEESGSTLRLTVITALGALGDPRAMPILMAFVDDPDSHVSKRAFNALETLQSPPEDEAG